MADKKSLVLPALLITLGTGWLLTVLGVAPGINWVWTLCLATAGVLTLAIYGLDKVSIVIGPFFLTASCLSVFRQTGRLSTDLEVPILVIASGLLLMLARMPSIPAPRWLLEEPGKERI